MFGRLYFKILKHLKDQPPQPGETPETIEPKTVAKTVGGIILFFIVLAFFLTRN